MQPIPWDKISIAPMMDITDRRFRYFMRLINPSIRLYTEMIVSHAIVRGDRKKLLDFDAAQRPVVLQLGGDDPRIVAEAARIGVDYGYDRIDLNCGCPSDRVESGNFGVCLMREPEKVAGIVAAMRSSVTVPVSVKCRIGITGEASEAGLQKFAKTVFDAGAASLTVHARTATLGKFSPKQNREIPPLDYAIVYRLKQKFPEKEIEINGGIRTADSIAIQLAKVDRVMIGRLAHEDPAFFCPHGGMGIERRLEIMQRMADYAARYEKPDLMAAKFFNTMLNIFRGFPGARFARKFLSEQGRSMLPTTAIANLARHVRAQGI